MNYKESDPYLSYNILKLDHTSVFMTAPEFHQAVQDDEFLKQMQCFNCSVWQKSEKKTQAKPIIQLNQCLIVRNIDRLESWGQSALGMPSFDQKYLMITYTNTVEHIRRNWVLFDRNMELLFHASPDDKDIKKSLNLIKILGSSTFTMQTSPDKLQYN